MGFMAKFDILEYLVDAVKNGFSDVHIKTNEPPVYRKDGKICKSAMDHLTEDDIFQIIETIAPSRLKNKAFEVFDLDFAFELKGISRFRINISREIGRIAIAIRIITYDIPNINNLNLPKTLINFTDLTNGIVLVTGPTGSGKSTTIAAILEYINANHEKHIITIEDPIEFIYTDKKSLVTQRQIEMDTPSYPEGIKYALRQDPDVILIGEIRDVETMQAALKASETGHLVFATMHTNDAIQTINRILSFYDARDREAVRKQVAETLRGTIAQKLIPRKDNKGRVPACELLVVTPTVKDFILKNQLDEVYDLVRKGSFSDMLTLNMSLYSLARKDIISEENAIYYSDNKVELQQYLRGAYHGTSGKIHM